MLPHIYKDNGTISIGMPDGSMKQIDTAHINYDEIVAGMKAGQDEKVINLINIAQQIERSIRASADTDNVKIVDGEVLFQGDPIHNSLTTRIITMADEGFDIVHMVRFLENLMMNPSYRAVNELYNFLEAGAIPITENGTFLSYKKINENYKDCYTNSIDNSIGKTVSMNRNHVNEDSAQTCSAGLHVCSYDYLPSYGVKPGARVVICEIHPRDVVSIPDDYNNTKMRVCSYVVIGEVADYKEEDILGAGSVMMTEDVPQPEPVESDDQIATHGKAIGKMVSNELDNDEVTRQNVIDALIQLNIEDDVAEQMCSGSHKQIGKTISRAIRDKKVSPYPFEDSLMETKAEDGCPSYDDDEDEEQCDNCGADLNGNPYCYDCEDDEESPEPEDSDTCPRCGGTINYGEDECQSCGYFI